MIEKIISFLDKLEDKIRHRLSRKPILYAFIGGIGVVLFWRGVWHFADYLMSNLSSGYISGQSTDTVLVWWDGPLSLTIGILLLLSTGVLVSSFIGNELIISGLKGEKKTVEKTESELKTEAQIIKEMDQRVQTITDRLEKIEKKIDENIKATE
jgi:hypothetical protein